MASPDDDSPEPWLRLLAPDGLHPARGFSHGVIAPAGGRTLYVAGQIGCDEELTLVSDDLAEQFERALANVVTVVEAAGGRREHLARLVIYVTDRDAYVAELPRIGRAYRAVMGRHFPAMVLAGIQGLMLPGSKVEIEGVAVLPPAEG